jgi:hypothetical protein
MAPRDLWEKKVQEEKRKEDEKERIWRQQAIKQGAIQKIAPDQGPGFPRWSDE